MRSMRQAAQRVEDLRHRERPLERRAADHREEPSDPMTPQQYYDTMSRRNHHDGETRLLFAVLEDAIRCYAVAAKSPTRAHNRELEEVREWVNTRGDHDVFSFDSICAVFAIEPETLRNQLNSTRIANFPARRLRTVGRRTALTIPD